MRILLVRPKPDKETIGLQNVMICEPLELEYVSSYLEMRGHEVLIVDMILEIKPLQHFMQVFHPDIVGITAYISHVTIVKAYAAEVKSQNLQCKVLVGGVHAEVVPQDFRDQNIDYILQGNGLKTFGEIVDALESGKSDFSDIGGIWTEKGACCVKEGAFSYPFPDRDKVKQYRKRYYYMFHNPCALLKTSFGCPFSCSFCFCHQITGGKYFVRDLKEVIEEIKQIPEKEIYIVDDNFLVDRDRILEFCRLLDENKLDKRFLIYGRADFIAENEDVIQTFAASGLRAVIVGLESCKQGELELYNKKSFVHVNEKAVDILKKAGVECYATLILGMDWTDGDFDGLYRWLKKLGILFINLQPFTPLPGTPLFDQYKNELVVPREEYEKWDLAHLVLRPSYLSGRRYYWNIVKLYYRVTMRPDNVVKIVKKYGIWQSLKLSTGASAVTWQYIKKIVRSSC